MKNLRRLPSLFGIAFVIATLNVIVLGQANENQFATLTNSGGGVRFDVSAPHAAVTLTVIGPDNYSFSKEFKSGSAAEFRLAQAKGDRLPDGQYTYELRVTPNISKEVKDALKAAREKGNESDVLRELRKNGGLPAAGDETRRTTYCPGSAACSDWSSSARCSMSNATAKPGSA